MLALRALGVGDLLTAVPAFRALRRAFPDHRLLLAAPKPLEPLALAAEAADEVVHAEPLAPLPSLLAGADLAVNLHGRGPESHRVLLAVRPCRLLAFAHEDVPESAGLPVWRTGEHEVDRWSRLLNEAGVPTDPTDLRLDPARLPPGAAGRGATLLHPGAASGARRWPAERFAAVARREREAGRRVLVTGGPVEEPLARAVAETAGLPARAVLAGRTTLLELAGLVAAAGRVVCGDTGVAHLATALGTPSVVLFGPTPPNEWGPRSDRRRHRALWAGLAGDPHGAEPAAGLLALEVTDVLGALDELDRLDLVPRSAREPSEGSSAVPDVSVQPRRDACCGFGRRWYLCLRRCSPRTSTGRRRRVRAGPHRRRAMSFALPRGGTRHLFLDRPAGEESHTRPCARGIVAPLVYLASDVIAGMRWEGYSFRDQTISELKCDWSCDESAHHCARARGLHVPGRVRRGV